MFSLGSKQDSCFCFVLLIFCLFVLSTLWKATLGSMKGAIHIEVSIIIKYRISRFYVQIYHFSVDCGGCSIIFPDSCVLYRVYGGLSHHILTTLVFFKT